MKGEFMKTMKRIETSRVSLKLGVMAPLVMTGLAMAPHAWADSVPLAQQSTMVFGSGSASDSFTAQQAGTVTVNLQDLGWPNGNMLSSLSFSAGSATSVLSSFQETNGNGGTFSFDVAAGTYFANIVATAGSAANGMDMGLYSLMMTFTPAVPLPSTGWLLLTGLFVLGGLARVVRPFELMGTAAA
jgi:hypothetical protein